MAISQIVWSLDDQKPLQAAKLKDEAELEELLYAHIDLLNPSWLVIGRQITMPSGKRLDLLCIDQDGDLIVVELKKELTPREVTAQAIGVGIHTGSGSRHLSELCPKISAGRAEPGRGLPRKVRCKTG